MENTGRDSSPERRSNSTGKASESAAGDPSAKSDRGEPANASQQISGPEESDCEHHHPSKKLSRATRRVELRNLTQIGLLIIAGFFALYFARAVFFPITLAVILNLLLSPIVAFLHRLKIPHVVGSILVIVMMVVGLTYSIFQLTTPAARWIEQAPQGLIALEDKLSFLREPISKIKAAERSLEQATDGGRPREIKITNDQIGKSPRRGQPPAGIAHPRYLDASEQTSRVPDYSFLSDDNLLIIEMYELPEPVANAQGNENKRNKNNRNAVAENDDDNENEENDDEERPVRVRVEQSSMAETVLSVTGNVLVNIIATLIILFFLLASGDHFTVKIVEVMPSLQDKKKAVLIVRSIQQGISQYLLSITLINIVLGTCIGFTMWLLGLPNPILWGVMGAVFNYVPYLGALTGVVMIGLASILTFDNIGYAVIPPLAYYCLTALEGNFITPYVLGVRLSLSPVIIFIMLLFWLWLWGIPGALLAVPMLAAFKILCDNVDALKPIGNFLVK